MNCTDPLGCPCETHVSPRTHVPTCPTHDLPLVWAPDGYGKCLAVTRKRNEKARLAGESAKSECVEWGPVNWNWLPRELFNDDDLPPHNGYRPPEYHEEEPPTYRLDVVMRCPDCGFDTPHTEVTVDGRGVVICNRCEVGRWT